MAIGMLLIVPGLNIIALLLILVPYTVLYTQLNQLSFLVHVAAVVIIGAIIIDPIVFVCISVLALIPSIILGRYYKRGVPSTHIVPRLTGIMLVVYMAALFVIQNVFGVSFLDDMRKTMTLTLNNMASLSMAGIEWNNDMTESFVKLMLDMIPFVFFIMAFLTVVCSHYIARRVVASDGVPVPKFPEAKDWRLPRSLIFFYLIVYLMQFSIDPMETSFFNVAVANLVPVLAFLFSIQAVGFFFFLAHDRGWSRVIPIIIAIPVLLIPPLSIIGILDLAFPLRKSFSKKQ